MTGAVLSPNKCTWRLSGQSSFYSAKHFSLEVIKITGVFGGNSSHTSIKWAQQKSYLETFYFPSNLCSCLQVPSSVYHFFKKHKTNVHYSFCCKIRERKASMETSGSALRLDARVNQIQQDLLVVS